MTEINKNSKTTILKKIFFSKAILLAIAIAVLIVPVLAVAQVGGETDGSAELENPLGETDIYKLIESIAEIIFKIGFLVAAICLILSGLKFVTARGNPEELAKARKMFMWTVIGAAVLLGAVIIVEAIQVTVESFRT